jgi:Arc/MetJ-type ribon-helix-helix transcriptional regulator
MAETEKITINMSIVDLGKVDLLVEEGFYSNRTDFIRTAIRNQLNTHADSVQRAITMHSYVMGIVLLDQKSLQRKLDAGKRGSYYVIGLLHIADDVSPELADQTIEKIVVRGVLRAPEAVKQALQGRMS